MRLFDTHAHLQLREFNSDRDAVLKRAEDAGVAGLLVPGVDVATSEAAIDLAASAPAVSAAAGCHPHDARFMDDAALARLAELARHPQVVAVGEIGLDFYRNLSPHDKQVSVFQRQLETAAEVAKPVAVHCREAKETLFPLMEAWAQRLGCSLPNGRPLGVLHSFSEELELAERYVELGFLISIHTSVTYPKAQQLQEVARRLPLETLVVETDSPYGPPQSRRGRRPDGRPPGRNEPAYVAEAIAKIAELRNEPIERVAEATTENAHRLFAPARQHAPAAGTSIPSSA